jgi:hypothetical protein
LTDQDASLSAHTNEYLEKKDNVSIVLYDSMGIDEKE